VEATGSKSCTMAGFSISNVERSDSTTEESLYGTCGTE
jgi:hypothetical protein